MTVTLACLTAPWLNPFAPGPSASIMPWLFALACIGVLGLLLPAARPRGGEFALLAAALVLLWLPRDAAGFAASPELVSVSVSLLALAVCRAIAGAARQSGWGVEIIAWAWLASAVISCVIGLFQYFDLARHFTPWMSVPRFGEAFANLRQRNQFATLTSIGLVALLWLQGRFNLRGHAFWLAALMGVGTAMSLSRIGFVQIAAIGALTAMWPAPQRRRLLQLCAAMLLAGAVATLAMPSLQEWVTGQAGISSLLLRMAEDPGCTSRRVLYANVVELIGARPWLGWGWGELDFAHYDTLYAGTRFCEILDNAHDLPLHLAVELGVPAAVLVCGFFLWRTVLARPWREADPSRRMAWSVIAVILLHNGVEYPLWYGPFQMAFGLSLGLLWPRSDAALAQPSPVPPWAGRVVAGVLLLGAFAAMWDYRRVSQVYLAPEARDAAYREDTLARIGGSWLFRSQVGFADLTTSTLAPDNAQRLYALSGELLHYSPEPRVIEKRIESAVMTGNNAEALRQIQRYRAAFPKDYAAWRATHAEDGAPAVTEAPASSAP